PAMTWRLLTVVVAAVSLLAVARDRTPGAAVTAASVLQRAPAGAPPPKYPDYELVWADEFDRDGQPDAKNWTYERGFVRNRELQWYRPENARVAGGLLTIE